MKPATKHLSQRSCDGCRATMDKGSLLRLVCDDEGTWWPDLQQKAQGRGTYLCLQLHCLRRLQGKGWQRIFADCERASLLARISDAIGQRLLALMHRLRGRSLVGKDAVEQGLWQPTPWLVVVAEDASSGVWDRIVHAVDKHGQQQTATRLLRVGTVDEFGAIYGRDRVAVIAWQRDVLTDRLAMLLDWRQQMMSVM